MNTQSLMTLDKYEIGTMLRVNRPAELDDIEAVSAHIDPGAVDMHVYLKESADINKVLGRNYQINATRVTVRFTPVNVGRNLGDRRFKAALDAVGSIIDVKKMHPEVQAKVLATVDTQLQKTAEFINGNGLDTARQAAQRAAQHFPDAALDAQITALTEEITALKKKRSNMQDVAHEQALKQLIAYFTEQPYADLLNIPELAIAPRKQSFFG